MQVWVCSEVWEKNLSILFQIKTESRSTWNDKKLVCFNALPFFESPRGSSILTFSFFEFKLKFEPLKILPLLHEMTMSESWGVLSPIAQSEPCLS